MHLFRLHRAYSPNDNGGGAGGEGGAGGGEGGKGKDPRDAELAELREYRVKAEAAAARRADDEKKAADEAAAKRGEHEALATKYKGELDEANTKLAGLEKRETDRLAKVDAANKDRVAKIPEDRRSLVPPSLRGDDLADYLQTNWSLLTNETERPAGTMTGGKRPPKVELTDDQKAEADRRGVPHDKWGEILLKSGRIKQPGTGAEA